MDPSVIGSAVRDYGWLFVMVWFAMHDIWPFLSQSIFPARVAERQAQLEAEKAERAADVKRKEREILAWEQVATAVRENALMNAKIFAHLDQVLTVLIEHSKASDDHHRETAKGMATMYERTREEMPKRGRPPRGVER